MKSWKSSGRFVERGVSIRKEQTLLDLYEERKPLYEKYADYVVDCEGKSIREVVEEMTKLWKKEIKKWDIPLYYLI